MTETNDAVRDPDASLLGLVDRLTAILERTELDELEVEAGATSIVVRKPSAIQSPVVSVGGDASAGSSGSAGGPVAVGPGPSPAKPSVKAPLTGIFYSSPSPGATPYVAVGDHVSAGQVIGLIEAMKLFNEIKSDLSGRVARIVADNGALVKAKQPLLEVDPQ